MRALPSGEVRDPGGEGFDCHPQFFGEFVRVLGPDGGVEEVGECDEPTGGEDLDDVLFECGEMWMVGCGAAFEVLYLVGEGAASACLIEAAVEVDATGGEKALASCFELVFASYGHAWVVAPYVFPWVPAPPGAG